MPVFGKSQDGQRGNSLILEECVESADGRKFG